MPSLQSMETSVYAVLRDSSKTFVLTSEVREWINEAQLDIVARTGLLRKVVTGTTSATGTITLPADFIKKTSFWVATDDADQNDSPEFARDDVFLSYRNAAWSLDKTLYRIFNGVIETYPVVVSRAYNLEYVHKPTELSTGGSVPQIPEELHIKLVNYARAQSKWKEGEEREGDKYYGLYLDGLPPVSTDASERENPGPIDFTPVMGYWDVEGEWR